MLEIWLTYMRAAEVCVDIVDNWLVLAWHDIPYLFCHDILDYILWHTKLLLFTILLLLPYLITTIFEIYYSMAFYIICNKRGPPDNLHRHIVYCLVLFFIYQVNSLIWGLCRAHVVHVSVCFTFISLRFCLHAGNHIIGCDIKHVNS